ncbi:hypothetical protein L6452_22034 [Arctium lappa]|uniref:Uncharacterized protein n=1 Tax=Arctium lappa TaxID=4217 RepID=A0ACB9B0C9_ARCLA|nr:hypothetical protein L6452_22034 [Arctium lappa]
MRMLGGDWSNLGLSRKNPRTKNVIFFFILYTHYNPPSRYPTVTRPLFPQRQPSPSTADHEVAAQFLHLPLLPPHLCFNFYPNFYITALPSSTCTQISGRDSPNCTMSDYVCEDLIAEIFGRLPPKSLLRFRSLSKSWHSRIASPDFIHKHTLRCSKNMQKILLRHQSFCGNGDMEDFCTLHSEDRLPLCPTQGYMGITPVEYPSYEHPSYNFEIVGSCNGILCMFEYEVGKITLWNPSIRRRLALPDHPSLRNFFVGSSTAVGFGFDPITDDYKIVVIPYSTYNGAAQKSLVYTINTGTWRAIASPATPFYYVKSHACFINGALHWVVMRYPMNSLNGHCYIMSFDVSTEVFGSLLLPGPTWETRGLTIINGSLAMFTNESRNCRIWMSREYHNFASWSTVFKLVALPCEGAVQIVFVPTTNGYIVIHTECEGYKVYNPTTGVRSRLVEFEVGSDHVDMVTYVESLALLNIGTAYKWNQPSCNQTNKHNG